jgi:hypothetical protein
MIRNAVQTAAINAILISLYKKSSYSQRLEMLQTDHTGEVTSAHVLSREDYAACLLDSLWEPTAEDGVVPEPFARGCSEFRSDWFFRADPGLQSGNPQLWIV